MKKSLKVFEEIDDKVSAIFLYIIFGSFYSICG